MGKMPMDVFFEVYLVFDDIMWEEWHWLYFSHNLYYFDEIISSGITRSACGPNGRGVVIKFLVGDQISVPFLKKYLILSVIST